MTLAAVPLLGRLDTPLPVDSGPTRGDEPLEGFVPRTDEVERVGKPDGVYGPWCGDTPLVEVLFAVIPPNMLPLETPAVGYVAFADVVGAAGPTLLPLDDDTVLVKVEVALMVTWVVCSTVLVGEAETSLIPLAKVYPYV